MTTAETFKVIAYLKAAYPRQEIKEETVMVYADAMKTLDFAPVMIAAKSHAASSPFFPSIAELIKPIAEAAVGAEPGEQAWVEVGRAISRWGRYREWTFANSLIEMTVEAMGKENLCNSTEPGVDRAQFIRIYNSYLATEHERAKHAPLLGRTYERKVIKRSNGPQMAGDAVGNVLKLAAAGWESREAPEWPPSLLEKPEDADGGGK